MSASLPAVLPSNYAPPLLNAGFDIGFPNGIIS